MNVLIARGMALSVAKTLLVLTMKIDQVQVNDMWPRSSQVVRARKRIHQYLLNKSEL